jgi:hypothetical protein
MKFMAHIVIAIHDDYDDDLFGFEDTIDVLFSGMRWDIMGLSTVYYWPQIPWRGKDEDEGVT